MADEPVLEASRGSSEQLFHRGLHLRFELWMIAKDVEHGLRVRGRQLLPGLVVRNRLEGERAIQRCREPRDLFEWGERFGAAEPGRSVRRALAE